MTHREDIRTAAVWCPDWPAVAAARAENIGPERPVAVLGQRGVVACNAPARAAGVRRGIRRRDAQFRCPDLVVVEDDPTRDVSQFEKVVQALDAAVAGTELLRPGLVVLGAPGAVRFYGGVDELVAALVSAVAHVDVECLVGIADELPTACLAAREGACLAPGSDAAYLAQLPVRFLAAEPALLGGPELEELLDLLQRLGMRTLGAFAALRPADVATRFGALGTTAHRIARGERWRVPSVSVPPPGLDVAEQCDPPLERVDLAAFIGRRLAVRLHAGLAAAGMACVRLAVTAHVADGREVRRVWRCTEPLSAEATADRVRWQLDGWIHGGGDDAAGAIVALALEPLEVVPAGHLQEGLWGTAGLAEARARRALQRVQGLLGTEAVRVVAATGARSPHQQVVTAAYGEELSTVAGPWTGLLPGPSPAVIAPPASYRLRVDVHGQQHLLPLGSGVQLVDEYGTAVEAGTRGLLSRTPARVRCADTDLDLLGWSAPWPVDEAWWRGGQLRMRMQIAPRGAAALLLSAPAGATSWTVEGVYE